MIISVSHLCPLPCLVLPFLLLPPHPVRLLLLWFVFWSGSSDLLPSLLPVLSPLSLSVLLPSLLRAACHHLFASNRLGDLPDSLFLCFGVSYWKGGIVDFLNDRYGVSGEVFVIGVGPMHA